MTTRRSARKVAPSVRTATKVTDNVVDKVTDKEITPDIQEEEIEEIRPKKTMKPTIKQRIERYAHLLALTKQSSKGRRRTSVVRPIEPKFNHLGEQLYCECHEPDDEEFMIECDTCKDWFHGECVQLSESEGEKLENYVCEACETFILGEFGNGRSS